ncbi:MAG: histidine triad nucleotide-binding protein [Vulcanimicrobiaceae bacterium]
MFRDTNPQAPTHLLVIPKRHARDLGEFVDVAPPQEIADLLKVASETARAETGDGYRIVANQGVDGGQTVHHLHFHVLGGRLLQWPPG